MFKLTLNFAAAIALTTVLTGSADAQTAKDSIISTVQEFFDAMTARDVTAARNVMVMDGQYHRVVPNGDQSTISKNTFEQYVTGLSSSNQALLERMWDPTVLQHGPIAVLWTDYDFYTGGEFSHCGVDAFHLIRTNERWKISGIVFTIEREGCPPSRLARRMNRMNERWLCHLFAALFVLTIVTGLEGQVVDGDMGVGMVKPYIMPTQTLYFYGAPPNNPFGDRPVPVDSLTFAEGQYYIDIETAPPWFQPEYAKLDYDILLLRAVSLRRNWIEVVVNKTEDRTAWVDRTAVQFSDWGQFILEVFAVEQTDPIANPIRVRPLSNAGIVRQQADVLYPLTIRGDWVQVMLDMEGETTGWIKWREGTRLLVTYSLLS